MNKLFFYSIVFLVTVIGGQDYDGGLDFEDGQDYEDYAENNNTTQDEPLELRLVDDLIADMTLASYGVYDVPNHLRKFQRVAERFLLRSFQLGSVVARSLYISREKQSVDYKALMKFNKVLAQLYENTTRALGYGLYSINVNASKPTVDYLKAVLEPLKIYRPYALKFTNPSVDKTQQEIVQLKELCLISKTPGDLIQIIREQAVKRCSPADKLTGVHGLISFLVSFCMRELMDQLNTIVQPYRELITQVSLKTKNAPDLNQFEESIRNSCSSNSYSGSLNRTLEHLPRTLILLNVIYFKGQWLHKFDAQNTISKAFYAAENREIQVEMMNKWGSDLKFDYYADDQLQCLALPYLDHRIRMCFLLPRERYGLDAMLDAFDAKKFFCDILPRMAPSEVNIALPKFRLEWGGEMKKLLDTIGITSIFSPTEANLSEMTKLGRLYVDKVIHRAVIQVDEEGSEAAAATAGVERRICKRRSATFIADHPFFFALLHAQRNLLFCGVFRG